MNASLRLMGLATSAAMALLLSSTIQAAQPEAGFADVTESGGVVWWKIGVGGYGYSVLTVAPTGGTPESQEFSAGETPIYPFSGGTLQDGDSLDYELRLMPRGISAMPSSQAADGEIDENGRPVSASAMARASTSTSGRVQSGHLTVGADPSLAEK